MTKKVKIPLITRQAEVTSFNEEENTIDVVFTTGVRILRQPWFDEPFTEELSTKPSHVRLDRLNAGGPFLDTHRIFSGIASMLGSVKKGSAKMSKGEGLATIRLSVNPDKQGDIADIKAGIISQVSVGYRVHKFKEIKKAKDGEPRVLLAIDWEPAEISAVPIPADIDAGTRSEGNQKQPKLYNCEILSLREDNMPNGNGNDDNKTTTTPAPEVTPEATRTEPTPAPEKTTTTPAPEVTPEATRTEPTPAPEKTTTTPEVTPDTRSADAADIVEAGRTFNMPNEDVEKFIREGKSANDFRKHIQVKLAEGDTARSFGPSGIVVGSDMEKMQNFRTFAVEALLHRANPGKHKLTDNSRNFAYLSLMELGREYLGAIGVSTRGMSKTQVADILLNNTRGGGMNSSSDFAFILADVANKMLRDAYAEAPQTFEPLVRRVQVADFKEINRIQLGEVSKLKKVLEHAEIKRKSISEAKEKYSVETYANIIALTRKTLINDDMNAFTRIPAEMGMAVRELEADLVWDRILNNEVMGDGNALFSGAHNNTGTGAISVANVGTGRTAVRRQLGLDGRRLNLNTSWLIVPVTLETVAQQFLGQITPNDNGQVNPFAGSMKHIAEPRLDDKSTLEWYLSGDKSRSDIIELATLEGEDGPSITTREGFDVEGVEIKVRHDVAAKTIDHRPLYRSTGA